MIFKNSEMSVRCICLNSYWVFLKNTQGLSICLYQQNDLGFRPNTQSTNYAVKPIFPGKWLCKLILSVGFVLLSGNFDRKRDRERGEFCLKNDFLDISTCINALSLWATIEWTSTQYGDKTQLHENCSEPVGSDLPQTREMVHWQVLPPPVKAGQAGQVLLQCWKLWFCVKKSQRCISGALNQWPEFAMWRVQ